MLAPDRLQRLVAFPAALLCSSLLVLGAWREEIRPGFMDGPSRFARRVLHRVGITHGMAVFSSPYDQQGSKRIIRARCLEVLGSSGDGRLEPVYPEENACPPRGIRLQVPPEEIVLSRLLIFATADEAERVMEQRPPPPPGLATASQVMLPAIAHYFAHREELRGHPRDRLVFLLTHHMRMLDGSPDFVVPVMVMDVSFRGGPSRVQWFPTPQQARRLWPGEATW